MIKQWQPQLKFTKETDQMKTMMNKNMAKSVKTLTATTNGKGYWSTEKRTVGIKKITIENIINVFGESIDADSVSRSSMMYLRVYFTKKDWNIYRHGLIYTDTKWIAELRRGLRSLGLKTAGLDYTEQGMQGDYFVSVCVYCNPKTISSLLTAFS